MQEQILKKLEARALWALTLSPQHLQKMPPASNLFVWQSVLKDLGAAYKFLGDHRFAEHGKNLSTFLASGGWEQSGLVEEIHKSFLLNALCAFFWDTEAYISRSDSLCIRELLGSVAAELLEDSTKEEWGKAIRMRNAWNHTIIAFSGIGTAGLLLAEHHADAARWREIALERTLLFFRDGISDAGMTYEGHAYCGFVFRNLGVFLRRSLETDYWDYTSPSANPYLPKLCSVPLWYAADLFPVGANLQAWNDSYWEPHLALCGFLTVFGTLAPAIANHVWARLVGPEGDGSFGDHLYHSSLSDSAHAMASLKPPRPPHRSPFFCREVGYLVDGVENAGRSSIFSFNSGEYIGAIHDQADNNSFMLFLDDMPVIIDSGAVDFPEEGNGSSSFGHNAVIIDGKGQSPCGHGHGCSGAITDARIGVRSCFVRGDAIQSYNARRYNPVRRAVRQCYFLKFEAPCVVVFDELDKDGQEHDYSILLHTPRLHDAAADASEGTVSGTVEFDGFTAKVWIRFLAPALSGIERTTMKGLPPFDEHDVWHFSFHAREVAAVYAVSLENGPAASSENSVTLTADHAEAVLKWPDRERIEHLSFDRRPNLALG